MVVQAQPASGAAWLARSIAGGAALVTLLALGAAARAAPGMFHEAGTAMLLALGLAGAASAGLGAVVASRVRGNPVGPLLTVTGLLMALQSLRAVWSHTVAIDSIDSAVVPVVAATTRELGVWLIVAVALLVVLFPSGRLPSRRWSWLPRVLVVTAAVHHLGGVIDPSPYPAPLESLPRLVDDRHPLLEALTVIVLVALLGLVLLSIGLAVRRFRRAVGRERKQFSWVALGCIVFLSFPVVCLVEIAIFGEVRWFSLAAALAGLVALPAGVGIAMLRHGLYDVDRAVALTFSHGLVVLVLGSMFGAAYAGGAVVLGASSALTAAAATAACAVALAPLQRRVRRAVDRRFYPLRHAALGAITQLHRRVDTASAEPEELQSVLATALRDPQLRVGYLLPGTAAFVDASGSPVPQEGSVPVTVGGETIGRLASPQLSPTLLRDLADHVAMLVEVVRLRLGLAQALHEVEASRARIVGAEVETRRQLERDLHDGAQQHIVLAGMTVLRAQRRLRSGAAGTEGLLEQAMVQLGTAVDELRRIANGIRPARLDDGLRPAIADLVRSVPIPVTLDIDVPERVPDSVTTAAYFVVSESLTNSVKHADAATLAVSVRQATGSLLVRVVDDGMGGADRGRGRGIAGLADRVESIGGSLTLHSPRGRGTAIEAVLPCG